MSSKTIPSQGECTVPLVESNAGRQTQTPETQTVFGLGHDDPPPTPDSIAGHVGLSSELKVLKVLKVKLRES